MLLLLLPVLLLFAAAAAGTGSAGIRTAAGAVVLSAWALVTWHRKAVLELKNRAAGARDGVGIPFKFLSFLPDSEDPARICSECVKEGKELNK